METITSFFSSKAEYLLVLDNGTQIPIQPSKYDGYVAISSTSRFSEPTFHISIKDNLTPTLDSPTSYKFGRGSTHFENAYNDWLQDKLVWYRGMIMSHRKYDDVRKRASLKSEGDFDFPTFTMGNDDDRKTRWLPGVAYEAMAQDVCVDSQAKGMMDLNSLTKRCIPIGFTVKVLLGKSKKIHVAWYNDGEQGIRGPLGEGDFKIHSLTCVSTTGGIIYPKWPDSMPAKYLPPVQPYNATEDQAIEWLMDFQAWLTENPAFLAKELDVFRDSYKPPIVKKLK